MKKPVRIAALGPHPDGPEAQVWIVQPTAAPAVTAAVARRAGRKPRVIVAGRCDPGTLTGDVATLESSAPVGALGVQRALTMGGQVVVTGPAERGAAVVGAAAWYHGWHLEDDLHRAAGALVGAIAMRGVHRGSLAVLEVDDHGGFVLAPADRDAVLGCLLLERAAGPSLPELEVKLQSVYLHPAGEDRVRGWGATGERAPTRAATIHVSFRGGRHEVPPLPPSSRRSVPMDLSESTMPMHAGLSGAPQTLTLDELAVVTACDHGDHLVLALWARDAAMWPWIEDWATQERAAEWLGGPAHVVRTALPNVSAVRFVVSGGWKGSPEALSARVRADSVPVGLDPGAYGAE